MWELPGGYVDEGEDLDAAAVRELEEETGWRAGRVEHLVSFQPMVGSADAANHVYMASECVKVSDELPINEATEVRWIALDEAVELIKSGELVGAASVVAIDRLVARRLG